MATAMHRVEHVRMIAEAVQTFRKGGEVNIDPPLQCLSCLAEERPGKKLVKCSGCKVALYCDQNCAKRDWNGTSLSGGAEPEYHRNACKIIKDSNAKLPEMQNIAKQFPWAQQRKDGFFHFTIFRAANNLLGSGREFGWWTQMPCCSDKSRYVWGFHLLEEEHISDDAGWKLPSAQVPRLDFSVGNAQQPKSPPPVEHSWSKYYAWRGLPLESPAALLLHWPLTVYRLLHILGLTMQNPSKRRHLTVHLLGIESEVDFLPIFGELALLFPNTDIDLVFFGPGVAALMEKARLKPLCLASRPFVYTYRAPEVSGGGTIRIELSRCGPFYDISNLNLTSFRKEKPDAIVALNAGMNNGNPSSLRLEHWLSHSL